MLIYVFEPHGLQRLQSPPFLMKKFRSILGRKREVKFNTYWNLRKVKWDKGKKVNVILRAIKRIHTSHPNIGIKASKRPVPINGEDFYFGASESFLIDVGKTLKKAGIKIARIIPAPIVLYFFLRNLFSEERRKIQDFALIDVGFDHTIYIMEKNNKLMLHTENYGVFHNIDKLAIAENMDLSLSKKKWIGGDPIFFPIINDSLTRAIEGEASWLKDVQEIYLSGVTMQHKEGNRRFSPFLIYRTALLEKGFKKVFPAMDRPEVNQNLLSFAGLWVLENGLLKIRNNKRRHT